MGKALTTSSDVQTLQDLVDQIYRQPVLPDESAKDFETFHEALLEELQPKSAYALLLAKQLVDLEWDLQRHRRFRNNLLRAEYRRQAVGAFQHGEVGPVPKELRDQKAQDLALDLVNDDAELSNNALKELREREITPSEIMAEAYRAVARDLQVHERQIADIEDRRRKLREEYEKLNAGYDGPVEDAEVIT